MEVLKRQCINEGPRVEGVARTYITLMKTERGFEVGKGTQRMGTYADYEIALRTYENAIRYMRRPKDY